MSELDDLAAIVQDLEDDFLLCRDLGHAWKLQGYSRLEGGRGLIARRLKCRVCKTKRVDRITRTYGTVYGRSYEHPEGYSIKGFGTLAADRSIYRRENMERAGLTEENEDA